MNHLYMLGGAGAVGAAGGGAYLIHNSISKTPTPTLESKLSGEKYLIMDSSDGNWATVVEKYNHTNTAANKKFSDLIGTATDQSLKQKCKSALASGDDALYEKAKLWCTVPRTVQQRLEDLGIRTLKMEGQDDKDTWNTLKGKYKDATEQQKIKELTISTLEGENAWQQLQTACKGYAAKDKWDADYDYFLEKVKVWCSSHE
ncbi:hypothetical protein HF1_09720 [Mycoplasma haemofelis str. Langford 1]|uniref:Uncharacterized protein n=1 Tax=Mycoplasma haemofelis (strain Langford 1) TaxID=941640 RepID=E8ZIK9_MYCHL|nr:hypothetical protein [Mycoplasma haemofelis]CBY92980.1 hypothetical protein HF1_09720 [Mycoplasma haemofelis str. Langford 1]